MRAVPALVVAVLSTGLLLAGCSTSGEPRADTSRPLALAHSRIAAVSARGRPPRAVDIRGRDAAAVPPARRALLTNGANASRSAAACCFPGIELVTSTQRTPSWRQIGSIVRKCCSARVSVGAIRAA